MSRRSQSDLLGLKRWLSGRDESAWDLLGTKKGAEFAVALTSFFWPEFVEVNGCVLLRERYDPSTFQEWWTELDGDMSRIERVVNHIHLWDFPGLDAADIPDDVIRDFARVLAASWRCALRDQFPERNFEVQTVLDEPEEYGPTIYISTVR